jgi:hypothetical protein
MQIDKGASLAVVVSRAWANLHGVKLFLRPEDATQKEIRGVDDSHILFAKLLDADDARGVWIEVEQDRRKENPAAARIEMLIPWSQVLTIVVAEKFSPAIRQEARRIGFSGETDRE